MAIDRLAHAVAVVGMEVVEPPFAVHVGGGMAQLMPVRVRKSFAASEILEKDSQAAEDLLAKADCFEL